MSNTVEVILNLVDNFTSDIESAIGSLDNLESSVSSVDSAIDTINGQSLEDVGDAASEAGLDVQQIQEAAFSADSGISSISSEPIEQAASAAKESAESAQEMAGGFDLVTGALSGLVSVGLASYMSSSVSSAGEWEDSWDRMAVALGSTADQSEAVAAQWQGSIDNMTSTTGRGAGTVKEFITSMAIAGVDSQDAVTASFNSISGAAYITGNDIDTISNAYQRAIKTGILNQRTLNTMGLSTTDVMQATGMSIDDASAAFENMDATQRSTFLSTIYNAKYGQNANEAYKQSWEHVSDSLSRAEGYVSRIFGSLILPIAIPTMETATNILKSVAGAVSGLNGPFSTLASIVAGGAAGWVILYSGAVSVMSVFSALGLSVAGVTAGIIVNTTATDANTIAQIGNYGITSDNIIVKAASKAADLASAAATALRTTALEVENGVSMVALGAAAAHTAGIEANTVATNAGMLSYIRAAASLAVSTVAQGAHAVAAGVSTAAQWALNAAMDANPIMLIVIAIMALVGVLFYLYNTNETVRNAINWLWSSLQQLGAYIMGGLIAAWNALTSALSPVTNALGLLWSAIQKAFGAFTDGKSNEANGILKQLGAAVGVLWSAFQKLAQIIGAHLSPYFNQLFVVLRVVWAFMAGAFSAVWRTISGIVMAFINYIATLITILANFIAGNITVGQALQQVWGAIKLLLAQVFMAILLGIGSFVIQMIQYAQQGASGLVNAFVAWISSLPGTIWGYLISTAYSVLSFAGMAAGYAAQAGSNIVNALSNYLSSLPGRMYQWGVSALQSFTDAIINSIPGLRDALNAVSSLFPHSPPKEGPLSTIKADNMRDWMSEIAEAGIEGFGIFNLHETDTSFPVISKTDSGNNELIINVEVSGRDEKDNKEIAKMVLDGVKDNKVIKQINIGLGNLRGKNMRSAG